MAKGPLQLQWTTFRFGISWSKYVKSWDQDTPSVPYQRFSIIKRTEGYTVVDHIDSARIEVHTLAAAHAWAGIRVGERCVRH